ncbi:hypothetical protein DERP_014357 [Dermatophagoides pteronyssinus]|uniref:Uncharacterized protein n=1 Tax=Dermatophagoides pteronyssinus TaxID=6956 RepID=A0ABQ8IUZ0_DERPT|nr:hypothetical protein DERP_014357 [Dermatophagoides pteronyssinus]
MVINIFFFFCE